MHNPTEISTIQGLFKVLEWLSSTFQDRFNFKDFQEIPLYIVFFQACVNAVITTFVLWPKFCCRQYFQILLLLSEIKENLIFHLNCLQTKTILVTFQDSMSPQKLVLCCSHDWCFKLFACCYQLCVAVKTQIRSDKMSGLIWIQTDTDDITEIIFRKSWFWRIKKKLDDKKHKFVCNVALCHSQQFFSHVRVISYLAGFKQ